MADEGGVSVQPDPDLILEDACSVREGLWRIAQLARDAAEALDARIEEDLDGQTEATDVCETLEGVHTLSLEVSEALDAYQNKHAH
jgi:hypothetical protein